MSDALVRAPISIKNCELRCEVKTVTCVDLVRLHSASGRLELRTPPIQVGAKRLILAIAC